MALYVEEFLFRGKGPALNQPGAWHVVLGNDAVADGFGGTKTLISNPMNPTQAAAAGFPLATILAAINSEALLQVDELTAANTALQTSVDTLTQQNATLTANVATLTAANTALQTQLTAATAILATARAAAQATTAAPAA